MFIPKMFFHFREKQSAKHVELKQALKLRLYVCRASLCSIFIFCCSFTAKLKCIPQLIITRRSSWGGPGKTTKCKDCISEKSLVVNLVTHWSVFLKYFTVHNSLPLCSVDQRLQDNYQRLEFQTVLHMIRETRQLWEIKAGTLTNENTTSLIRLRYTL